MTTSRFSTGLRNMTHAVLNHRAGPLLAVSGVYAILTVIMTQPLAWNLGAGIVGQAGDSYQHLWAYWWAEKALVDFGTTMADLALLYYPQSPDHLILWVTPMIQFIGLPFTMLFGPIVTYNLVYLFSIMLSGVTTYLLAYEVSGNHKAAFVGGLIFAFAPTRFIHGLGHHAQTITFLFPLYAWLLVRLLREPGLKLSIITGAALAAAAMINFMHLALIVIPVTVIVVGHYAWTKWDRFREWKRFGSLALTATVAFLLTSPFFVPFIRAQLNGETGNLKSPGVTKYGADLLAFFTPAPSNPLIRDATELRAAFRQITAVGYTQQNITEGIIYLGIIPLLLVGWGIWRRRQDAGPWVVMLLVTAILSLGPFLKINGNFITYRADNLISYIPLPYILLYELPFYDAVRTPSRFNTTTMLAMAVLVSIGVAALLNRLKGKGRVSLGVVALLTPLILLEYVTVWPAKIAVSPVPAFYESVAEEQDEFGILDYPIYLGTVTEFHSFDFPMYYQMVHEKPMAGGYIWRLPAGVSGTMRSLNNLFPTDRRADIVPLVPDEERIEILRLLNFRYVVIHKQDTQHRAIPLSRERLAELRADLTPLLGAPVYEDEYIVAFRVPEGVVPEDTRLITPGEGWGALEIVEERPWRWTVGDASTMIVYGGSEEPRRLSFRVRGVEGARTIRLLVNGEPVGQMRLEQPHHFVSPPLDLPLAQNEIRLEIEEPCVTAEVEAGVETAPPCRNLQIAEVELLPVDGRWGETPVACSFDNGIELLGYDLGDDSVAAGGVVDLTLYWRGNRPVAQEYTVFAHVLDDAGSLVAQQDNPPRFGTYPTSWWMTGEIVTDTYAIAVPEDIREPLDAALVVGFYTWPDGVRSGVDSGCPGASPDNYLELSDIEIRSGP